MSNGIDLATVQNLVNAIIVFVFAVFALVGVGGVAVFVALLRQNKRNLELAYQALPPEAQTTIRDLLASIKSIVDVLADISIPDQPETPSNITVTASSGQGSTLPSSTSVTYNRNKSALEQMTAPPPTLLSPDLADQAPG